MSSPQVRKTPRAYDDLDDAALYLAKKVDAILALRFLDSAEKTFRTLGRSPTLGAKLELEGLAPGNLRTWQIKGFDKYIIIYRPISKGIEVVRVIHGARDWQAMLTT
jgi:toxin ParE1/3/4